MKTEAERVGWPKHYKTDLTKHDRVHMSRKNAPEEFVWVLRECGTFLFRFGVGADLDWLVANYNLYGPQPNISGKTARWYIWRDDELREVEADEALAMFIESVKGQPVYKKNRRSEKIYIGTLRHIVPNTRTTYGHKTYIDIDRGAGKSTTGYHSDEVRIG
jgi:hypothetical protein